MAAIDPINTLFNYGMQSSNHVLAGYKCYWT